jgi:hypothetical protein
MVQQPPLGQGFLIIETSQSHSDTPHSVGLLWTSDQPVAETLLNTHKRQPSMTPARFELAVSGSEGQQTNILDRSATRIGSYDNISSIIVVVIIVILIILIIIIIIIIMRSSRNYKNSVEPGPFASIKSFSFTKIPVLCHTALHYHVSNNLHFSPIMSHMKPIHTSISYNSEYMSLLSLILRFRSHAFCMSCLLNSTLCPKFYVVMRTNHEAHH